MFNEFKKAINTCLEYVGTILNQTPNENEKKKFKLKVFTPKPWIKPKKPLNPQKTFGETNKSARGAKNTDAQIFNHSRR